MMKVDIKTILNKVGVYLLAALFYSLIIFFFTSEIWDIVFFLIGSMLGISFTVFDDEYLFEFYQDNDPKEATFEKKFVVTQSPLYILALIPTAVFIFTSSGSFFSMGFMGGLILFFLVEMARKINNPELFFSKFLSNVQFEHSQANLQKILIGSILFFIILHFLVLL